jgi:SAM-dependent MidA family methyltransferase
LDHTTSPLATLIRKEIANEGSIAFRRFMELALYHPAHGYYRRGRDPFGRKGDYYTAEQLQPVFGILIAAKVRALFEQLERPPDFTVVELGAGRGEMAQAFSQWRYVPVDAGWGELPRRFTGVVFANEFFDALPVEVVVRRGDALRQMRVSWDGSRFVWIEGSEIASEAASYVGRYLSPLEEGGLAEVNLEALRWIERIAQSLERGFVLTIDYGYTRRERARFPQGTLMSYQQHRASEDVLTGPGERDITAHVCFTALEEHARACGLETVSFTPLATLLLEAGEADAFAAALAAEALEEQLLRRQQLKTLLFGMGETFRALVQRKNG